MDDFRLVNLINLYTFIFMKVFNISENDKMPIRYHNIKNNKKLSLYKLYILDSY